MKPQKEIEQLLQQATKIANSHNHEYMQSEHLLYAMLNNEEFANVIAAYEVDLADFTNDLKQYIKTKIPVCNKKLDTSLNTRHNFRPKYQMKLKMKIKN